MKHGRQGVLVQHGCRYIPDALALCGPLVWQGCMHALPCFHARVDVLRLIQQLMSHTIWQKDSLKQCTKLASAT